MRNTRASLVVAATAALVAAVVFAPLAVAQSGRLSLSERVARLEAQAQGQGASQSNIELLNRLSELQAEVQSLRGLVEQQTFEIEGLKRRAREQYIDLDTRLSRFEGRGTPPAMTSDPNAAATPEQLPAPATDAGQLSMEPPAIQQPVDTPSETQPLGQDPAIAPTATVDGAASEKIAYDQAFDALKEGRYAESARRFSAFLEQYPSGEFAPNAYYWLGESYYVTQNYRIALETFEKLLANFPASAKAADALLKVGYCHYELKEWVAAESALNKVIVTYPESTVARLAQGRLRALKLEGRQP